MVDRLMTDKNTVFILLASYNGERYLTDQLDSLIDQSYTNWKLIIRDDGSTDSTVAIINRYIERDTRISLIENKSAIKGACTNFAALFDLAKNNGNVNYAMFCDQDDIWKSEKIEKYLAAMQTIEMEFKSQPVLIYGNFELMTTNGDYMPGDYKLLPNLYLKNLLSFNYVYGCTVIMNRVLIEKIDRISADAENHDYWVALVASIYKSMYIDEKLLRYRQHSNNTSGNVAGNNSFSARLKRNLLSPGKEIENLKTRLNMLTSFYNKYQDQLSVSDRQLLETYLAAFKVNRFRVLSVMWHNSIFRKGFFQTLASFSHILFFYSSIQSKNRF